MSRSNGWPNVIAVTPDSSKELKERVYRLRYQIYVEELKHDLANTERMIYDKYDDYSTNFLAEIDGEDVGVIRYMAKKDGPLESEEQHESWRSFISSSEKDPHIIGEWARVMAKRDHRGTRVVLALFRAARLHSMRAGTYRIYNFGIAGRVADYYIRLGCRDCIGEPRPFSLGNHYMGQYKLLFLDLGSPWSFRRARMRLRYGLPHLVTVISLPAQKALIRRGKGYSHQR